MLHIYLLKNSTIILSPVRVRDPSSSLPHSPNQHCRKRHQTSLQIVTKYIQSLSIPIVHNPRYLTRIQVQNPHRSDWKVQTLFISTNYGPVSSFLYAPKSNKWFLQSSLLPFFHWHVFFRVRHGGRYLYQTLNSTKRHCQLNQLQILSTKCKVSLPLRGRWKRPQDVKLIFFSEGHLAPKFFKVVANSKEVGRHFQRQTKPFFTQSAF